MDREMNTDHIEKNVALAGPGALAGLSIPAATGDYEVDRQRHIRVLQERLPGELERLTWPLERLHALRDERLRVLVRGAREYAPWHARRLQHVDPDGLSGDDLSALPTMTKADLMNHWNEIVTDPRLTLEVVTAHMQQLIEQGPAYLLDQYHVLASGGTSGQRGLFVWDFEGWLQAELVWRRYSWQLAHELHADSAWRVARIMSPNLLHGAAIPRTFQSQADAQLLLPITLPLREIVAGLNKYQPDIVRTYPSALKQLASEAQAGRLHIQPKLLLCSGEALSSKEQQVFEDIFIAPVLNIYACSECYWIGVSYPDSPLLHLFEDTAVYEPVDEQNRPVPPGTPAAKLLVTNVTNCVLPLIRYELTDRVMFLETATPLTGRGRTLAPVLERQEYTFRYQGGVEVSPAIFHAILDGQPALDAYQVWQTERGVRIKVHMTHKINLAVIRQSLVTTLAAAGLVDPEVELEDVAEFEHLRSAAGKHTSFVPLIRGQGL